MSRLKIPVHSNDHIWGDIDSGVELVEYGDYQCANCGHAFPLVKKIQHELGKKIRFIFRNFPLRKIHENAVNAAIAAEAAGRQNMFWEMHDLIFTHQEHLEPMDLLKYAEKLKLNLEQFREDLNLDELIGKVESDFESGIRSGVNRTPSFFINEEKFEGKDDDLLAYIKVHYLKIFDMDDLTPLENGASQKLTKRKLNKRIIELTTCISEKFPELMKYLDEIPASIPGEKKPDLSFDALKKYHDSLSSVLRRYKKLHPDGKKKILHGKRDHNNFAVS